MDVKCALDVEFIHIYASIIGAFEDPDIIHVDDIVDPVRDLEVISAELRLKVCDFTVWHFNNVNNSELNNCFKI